MSEHSRKISEVGFVPLIVLEQAMDAIPLAKALFAGGIPVAEVTFRTDAALNAISKIAQDAPYVLVGAGSVHTVQQTKDAVSAGAQFIVTPGFNPDVVRWCVDRGIDVFPGTASPADIEQVMALGLTICKFFPAEAYGGVKTMQALAGPYAGVRFLPTGGITAENMDAYLALPNVMAVGGSFMAPEKLVAEKRWEDITALCRETVKKHLNFHLIHVGLNTEDVSDARSVANRLGELFCQEIFETDGAYFAGQMLEVVKGKYLGAKGHIAIQTNDIYRAASRFERDGVALDHKTELRGPAGELTAIYLKEEIGGFAVHLRRK